MTKPPFRNSYVMGSLLSPCRRFSFHFALPAGADRPSLLARLCISSWASTISSSESCAQRRSCSRSAPSQVVRLQSIAFSSLPGIGKLSQIIDVDFILRPAGNLLHPDKRWNRNETHCNRPERLDQRPGIFLVEIERLRDEHIDRRVRVSVAPEIQRSERRDDVVGVQLNHEIDVPREAQVSVRVDRQPSGDKIAHTPLVERLDEYIEASQLHAGYFALFPCNAASPVGARRPLNRRFPP